MNTEKPCPFCGGTDIRAEEIDIGEWALVCQACGAIGPSREPHTIMAAVKAWNTRPGEVSPGGLSEAFNTIGKRRS
jgi:Lar family restriction alleviation protein